MIIALLPRNHVLQSHSYPDILLRLGIVVCPRYDHHDTSVAMEFHQPVNLNASSRGRLIMIIAGGLVVFMRFDQMACTLSSCIYIHNFFLYACPMRYIPSLFSDTTHISTYIYEHIQYIYITYT